MNNSMKTPLIRLAKREGMDKRTVWAIRVGSILLALLLAGLFAMALLRCFMIAFVEVASFNIGTYAMYLSTVHPLLLLFSAAGILTLWKENVSWQN